MSQTTVNHMKPFASVLIAIVSMLLLVFVKMEVRRINYSLLKLDQQLSQLKDERRQATLQYTQLTRPHRVREYAISQLTLNEVQAGQIIHLVGERIALRQ